MAQYIKFDSIKQPVHDMVKSEVQTQLASKGAGGAPPSKITDIAPPKPSTPSSAPKPTSSTPTLVPNNTPPKSS